MVAMGKIHYHISIKQRPVGLITTNAKEQQMHRHLWKWSMESHSFWNQTPPPDVHDFSIHLFSSQFNYFLSFASYSDLEIFIIH